MIAEAKWRGCAWRSLGQCDEGRGCRRRGYGASRSTTSWRRRRRYCHCLVHVVVVVVGREGNSGDGDMEPGALGTLEQSRKCRVQPRVTERVTFPNVGRSKVTYDKSPDQSNLRWRRVTSKSEFMAKKSINSIPRLRKIILVSSLRILASSSSRSRSESGSHIVI